MSESTQRKLAAIVSADVAGYTSLMEADEAGTHARLKARYRDLVEPKIDSYGGRVVKLMGDGLLAEFPSVVNATAWAVEIQNEIAALHAATPAKHRIEYRIGVNLGDVIVDGEDLFGDGVNLAARLQEKAEVGGVCISDDSFRQVRGKVAADFRDGGDVSLKNIRAPVRVWHWSANTAGLGGTLAPMAEIDLTLPDKPSIAVLPFDNLSGDPEQDYFSDGITDDIITELSRYPDLMVIARHSTQGYKDAEPGRIGRELGVRHLLQGSVRRAGERVRISAQLIEAANGHHVWAERYDRELADIFDLQDEITRVIVGAVGSRLHEVDAERAGRQDPANLSAYEWTLRANASWQRLGRDDIAEARELARAAIASDPAYARAYAVLAFTYTQDRFSCFSDDYDADLAAAFEAASKGVALDRASAAAALVFGTVLLQMRQHDRALLEMDRAIALSPNYAECHTMRGLVLGFMGRTEAAVAAIETALRLNPRAPGYYHLMAGRAHLALRDFAAALAPLQRAVGLAPAMTQIHVSLAVALDGLGRRDEAEAEVAEIRRLNPTVGVAQIREVLLYQDETVLDDQLTRLAALGLPE